VKVYLAGPINGCTDYEAIDWRLHAQARLGADAVIDPMRRDYRHKPVDPAELVYADLEDIENSTALLANCWKQSAGTLMELVYAQRVFGNVPTYVVWPTFAEPSPWIVHHATYIFNDLDDALNALLRQSLRP